MKNEFSTMRIKSKETIHKSFKLIVFNLMKKN